LKLAEDSFSLISGSEVNGMNKKFAFFNSKESHEGLRRNTNGRTCPLNLGPRILKIVVLELAEDSFILISGFEALKKAFFPAPNYAKVRVMNLRH
jgi:hypothetical protein